MPLSPLPEPKSFFARVWGFGKGFLAMSVLISVLVFINLLQTLSVILVPISRTAVRSINRALARFWWGWVVVWSGWWGTEVEYHGDELPERENALLVCNHQEMADIIALFFLARSKRSLGDLKFYVKDMIKYVPGVGWGMLFLDCIFLKRNWTADRNKIDRTFSKINKFKIPLWLVSFVEGTRVSARKLKASQEFAKKKGLEPNEHLLIPRTKGFVATVQGLRGHVDAVYDVTVAYVGGVPTLWQWTKGYVDLCHVHVRRFPMEELPQEEQEISDWLIHRFSEKDKLLDHYYKEGTLPNSVPVSKEDEEHG